MRIIEAQLGNRCALRKPDLRLHDIHSRDRFSHRVLHLQASVGLDERERPVGCLVGHIHQKLEGSCIRVADALCTAYGCVDDPIAEALRQTGGRRHLDDLLEIPLDAAFALTEMGHGTVQITEDLHLDVARPLHELLDVHVAVSECGVSLCAATLECRRQLFGTGDHPCSASAAAANGLDHHAAAPAEGLKELRRFLLAYSPVGTTDNGHAGISRGEPGPCLVPEKLECLDAGADEGLACFTARSRKGGVLSKEAVTRMHGVAAGFSGDFNDILRVQVGGSARAVEAHGFIRLSRME